MHKFLHIVQIKISFQMKKKYLRCLRMMIIKCNTQKGVFFFFYQANSPKTDSKANVQQHADFYKYLFRSKVALMSPSEAHNMLPYPAGSTQVQTHGSSSTVLPQ